MPAPARATVSARTPRARRATYSPQRMEFLAYLWDDLDDLAGACRHLALSALTETLETAVPFIAASSAILLACAAALLLAGQHLLYTAA
jgi:hypothetical protein